MGEDWHELCQDVELGRDPYGAIQLELYRDPRWIVSISISQDSCYWAALLGPWDPRGSCLISEGIPDSLIEVVNYFYTRELT